MARRTYVPTFVALLRRIERYIDRYDVEIVNNITADEKVRFDAVQLAVKQYLNLIDTQ